jgi:Kef-type K+ transport system membrane component KefB
MAPRGEVGIVIALIGLNKHIISDSVYAQVILMSVVTSFFAPSLLRALLAAPAEKPPAPESPEESPPGDHGEPTP